MQQELTTTITATVDRIRFEKNGFVIFAITDQKSKKKMGAKGTIIGEPKSMLEQTVVFEGVIVPTEYGDQIDFHHCAVEEGVNYFWRTVAKISKKAQDFIISRFGANPSWLNNERMEVIHELSTVPGIKEKTAEKILTRWADYQSIKQLMEIVSSYGIPQSQAIPIHKHFGDKACSVITKSPYQLTEVKGFGFKRADEIASKVGIAEDSPGRIYAGMTFAMNEAAENGSTCVTNESFMSNLNELIVMSDQSLAINSLEDLFNYMDCAAGFVKNPPLRISNEMVALQSYQSMDKYILKIIKNSKTQKTLTVSKEKALQVASTREDYNKLGDQQKLAVINVLINAGMIIISGYAGTGKTTTSKTALNIMSDVLGLDYDDIVVCALSGVAANRIKTQSGYQSSTIHSLLGTDEMGGWAFNEGNKLPQSIVVLDESGMVDTYLFFSLLKAIDFERTKLIMMGDPAQLPPVGAGQPFVDLIQSNLVPHTSLTKIYRQSEDKAIAIIAAEIRAGMRPSISKEYSDVFSYRAVGNDNQAINESIEEQVIQIAQNHRAEPPSLKNKQAIIDHLYTFQVITPRKSGALGQEVLSGKIREVMLPQSSKATCKDVLPVSVYDKMIHLKNMPMNTEDNESVRVFNGMVGMVTSISIEDDEFVVYYPLDDIYVRYNEKHLSTGVISYAWALTIHKTQGSEYQNIAIPFSKTHWNMLNNKLTYTAVTRAKNSCHLIGDVKAFHQACTNVDSTIRNTVFQQIVAK
jgi:exodeoxyribonuclease V alpha subunit